MECQKVYLDIIKLVYMIFSLGYFAIYDITELLLYWQLLIWLLLRKEYLWLLADI